MEVLETVRLRGAQPIEQRKDHERSKALRPRRRIVERAGLRRDAEGLGNGRPIFLQVGASHRAPDAIEIGGNFTADIAAIKIFEAGKGKMLTRCRYICLFRSWDDVW